MSLRVLQHEVHGRATEVELVSQQPNTQPNALAGTLHSALAPPPMKTEMPTMPFLCPQPRFAGRAAETYSSDTTAVVGKNTSKSHQTGTKRTPFSGMFTHSTAPDAAAHQSEGKCGEQPVPSTCGIPYSPRELVER
jgi:hypothetical protein